MIGHRGLAPAAFLAAFLLAWPVAAAECEIGTVVDETAALIEQTERDRPGETLMIADLDAAQVKVLASYLAFTGQVTDLVFGGARVFRIAGAPIVYVGLHDGRCALMGGGMAIDDLTRQIGALNWAVAS